MLTEKYNEDLEAAFDSGCESLVSATVVQTPVAACKRWQAARKVGGKTCARARSGKNPATLAFPASHHTGALNRRAVHRKTVGKRSCREIPTKAADK